MSRELWQKDFHEFNFDMEVALTAAVAWPTLEEACEYLYDTHDIEVTPEKLAIHLRRFPERSDKIRQELAPKLERRAANTMLDNAARASEVMGLAIEKTKAYLESPRCTDPSTVLRNLGDAMAKSVDKSRLLEEKPTHISADRSLAEVFRALQAIDPRLVIDDAEVVEAKALAEGG